MTTTPDFVDTLDFLSDTQCMRLREADLDVPAAFEHITVEHLLAPPFNLTLGKASRVLAAARAKVSTTPMFTVAPPAPMSTRIEQALATVAADPAKAGLLVELGVSRVVLGVDDKVSPALTLSMRAQEAAGAPVGPTWQGQRVVETTRLASPTVYCSPRTGSPLQAGADEVSGVLWGELGLDGLRETAFGYEEGLFEGRPEEAVFAAMKGGGTLREKVLGRMRALSVKPESLDRIVVFTPTPPQGHVEVSFAQPYRRPGRSLVENLSSFFMSAFSADELRRFIAFTIGRDFADSLPAPPTSLATLASEAADKLIRQRYVDRDLRDALYRERPRKSAEIDAVFSAAGI
jgi:hypothetical protein